MEEPKPEQFGYHEAQGFDDESGWMIEGGEEAYYEALEKWNETYVEWNWKVQYTTRSPKGKFVTTITTVSGTDMQPALQAANYKAKRKGAVIEADVIAITGIRMAYFANRRPLVFLSEAQRAALWQETLHNRNPLNNATESKRQEDQFNQNQ